MNFADKLINLRKKNALSQEGLAEKLNVTRQTVSKWELGESKPNMDKLIEISKIFNIGVDELTNDEIKINESTTPVVKVKNNQKQGDRKILLYILIIIFVASLGTLTYRIGNSIYQKSVAAANDARKEKERVEEAIRASQERIKKEQEKAAQQREQAERKAELDRFNRDFEARVGTTTDFWVEKVLDAASTNAKKNTGHIIEVIFDGVSYGTDPNSFMQIKNSLKNFNNYEIQYYEISVDYDSDGYVNNITITTR